jgi:hypothetical protein
MDKGERDPFARLSTDLYFISENVENISIKFGTDEQWRS